MEPAALDLPPLVGWSGTWLRYVSSIPLKVVKELYPSLVPDAQIISDQFQEILGVYGKVHRKINSTETLCDNEIMELGMSYIKFEISIFREIKSICALCNPGKKFMAFWPIRGCLKLKLVIKHYIF